LQEIKIFAGRFSTSGARQVFHQRFRTTGRFGDSIAPPAESLIGNPKYPPAQSICKLRNKCRSRVRKLLASVGLLSAASTKESLDISNLDRIFSAAGRRVKRSPENRAFLRLARSCRRHFSARAGSFRSSAEDLKLQLHFSNLQRLFRISC